MSKLFLEICPRCGTKALDKLLTYAHCVECLYFQDHYLDLETSYRATIRVENALTLPKPKNPIPQIETNIQKETVAI